MPRTYCVEAGSGTRETREDTDLGGYHRATHPTGSIRPLSSRELARHQTLAASVAARRVVTVVRAAGRGGTVGFLEETFKDVRDVRTGPSYLAD